ncbi:helix-turn-helix domain-containing protein [Streptomyces sp. NPDC046862]|uniref:helix-turn-helix domain-containing protein n=1 Tax=Streptomyces sp. NPDC046862 TaxID=3154603 RepID=UPI0034513772
MDTQNLSAPARPQQLNPRGITHINTPHTTRYTVVGNHLAQHRQLSLNAIGLALHIQSLPDQARVDIKTLADRFPEGETRIAAALRELKAHGYLAQVRKRLPNGRVVTHTVSYNQPQAQHPESGPAPAAPRTPPRPASDDLPAPAPLTDPDPTPEPDPDPTATPPAPPPSPAPKPSLPEPQTPDLDRHRTATALLTTLHHDDPRLLLSERAVRHLAPAVAAWLERGARIGAVRHTLTADLPEPLRNPAALLAHRLTELLPPPAPATPPLPHGNRQPAAPPPFLNCEGCERAIRTRMPGTYCRECREAGLVTHDAAA